MNSLIVGSVVSYQGRCWLVTRMMGAWLHLVTATGPNNYHAIDLPRSQVSTDLRATESGRQEMYCPFKRERVQ